MNNITFGQYIPGKSWLYKLDPRIKIILSVLFIVFIFIIPMSKLYWMLGCLGGLLLVFITGRINIIKVLKSIRPVVFLLIFTVILQLIYTVPTEKDEFHLIYDFSMQIGMWQLFIMIGMILFYFLTKKFMPLKITYLLVLIVCLFGSMHFKFDSFVWSDFSFKVYEEGVNKASFIFLRIVIMIGITSLLTLTTMTTDINNGIESVLSPLKLIKIPVGVLSMLISLTLRFIPTLLVETKKIMNAQASRGVDFNEGSLKDKISQVISLLIPMFVISFKRAEDLSNAMEARGYIIGESRTKLDELKLRWRDYLALLITILLYAGLITARVMLHV